MPPTIRFNMYKRHDPHHMIEKRCHVFLSGRFGTLMAGRLLILVRTLMVDEKE